MRAGDLRHRIEIQKKEFTQDGDTGEMVPHWVSLAIVHAKVEPLSVRELIAASAPMSKVSTRIVIRYRPGVDATMRIVFRGKTYNIEGVLPDKDSGLDYLTLPCSEGVNDG